MEASQSPLMNHLALAGAFACLVVVVARWLLANKGGKNGGKTVSNVVPGVPAVKVDPRAAGLTTHDYVHDLHEAHGNVFCDATPRPAGPSGSTEPVLYSSNPNTATFVLLKNKLFAPVRCPDSAFKTYENMPSVKCRSPFDLVQPMAKGTVFDLTGDAWKARKSCLASLFVVTEDVTLDFANAVRMMVPNLLHDPSSTKTVDAQILCYLLFVKGTLNILFGAELELPQDCWDRLERAVKHFGNTRYDYATPDGIKDPETSADTSYRANDHECYSSCVWEPCKVAVEWALKNSDKCPETCGFSKMMAQGFNDTNELVATAANFVVAAAESPASGMAHALALVCESKDVMAKMKEEVEMVMEKYNGEMNKDFCKDMVYTSAVIDEAFRIKAPATMVSREAIEDCDLPIKGTGKNAETIKVKAGTKVNLCIHAVHLNKDVWGDDCEEFKPERWLGENTKTGGAKGGGHAFMPFSAGARGCPGRAITVMWMKVLFAMLFHSYEMEEGKPASATLSADADDLVKPEVASKVGVPETGANARHISKFVSWIPTGIPLAFTEMEREYHNERDDRVNVPLVREMADAQPHKIPMRPKRHGITF